METDRVFAGQVPEFYDRHLGPIRFQPFAAVIVGCLSAADRDILEIAAGTGIVTRAVAEALPGSPVVATDLNQAMLDVAAAKPRSAGVTWRQADAQALPFADASFDAVICGFGVMFMPDKRAAFGEARRVLRPGGRFIFTVWDRFELNGAQYVAHETVAGLFPEDPPGFLARVPYGYHDQARIGQDLADAGFVSVAIEEVRKLTGAATAMEAAMGTCQGTPLRGEIEARDPGGLGRVTEAVAAAIRARYGDGPLRTPLQALLVTAR